MKICPNCGNNSDSKFCPDCGTLMEEIVDANIEVEMHKNCVEPDATVSAETIVERSMPDDYTDNFAYVNEPKVMVSEVKKKPKNIKKLLKIVGISVLAVVVLFFALIAIVAVTTPDLAEEESMKSYQINGMEYGMPESWEVEEEESSDVYHRYSKSKDGEIIAIADVEYTGENDLDSGDAAYTDEHTMSDGVKDVLPDCEGTYEEVTAGTSVFEVTVYAIPGEVQGEDAFLGIVTATFDVENYANSRKNLGVVVEYTGSTKAGVTIDSECEDLTVTQNFETILGDGVKKLDWTIDDPVTLKAGQTSTVVIKADGVTKKLKVECSTLSESQYKAKCKSRNYKDQLRESSYGEYIKIYGQVLQDCGYGYYRISSSGGYDDVYMVYAPDSDIVEDDWATVYGVTDGIYTYETVMGAEKKIPSIEAKYVYR